MNIKQKMKVKEIAEMTDNNDHGGALRLGISMLTSESVRDYLNGQLDTVESDHEYKGYLTPEMSSKRYEIYNEFKATAIQDFSHEDYNKLYGAF